MSESVLLKKPMPSNAFSTIVLAGIASNEQHPSLSLLLRRHQPVANTPFPSHMPPIVDIVPRPSHLAPPGNLRLSLSLGKVLGSGAVSRVYEATVVPSGSSSRLSDKKLPPLCVKVSRRGMASALLPEAQNYAEMATLQGHVIPRCYGLYSATIRDGVRFRLWEGQDEDGELRSDSGPLYNLPENEGVLAPNAVTILVMERLGEAVPRGELNTLAELPEIQAMYTDISTMGVVHGHVVRSNIVRALDEPALPVLTSPNWTKPYRYRLIDFHQSFKVNIEPRRLAAIEHVGLERLLNDA
ncbi:hypothetical protein EIP91_011886 [Steccherinum ochraceum]|uniref:Protein kinase domain-containing protein n=1 Tax=Steccherinum ochraceum TaxID=92696 RepID=A0A4R0RXQ8_9APHY|nr:hypothetical protein EIP91_011886 [Steccherinum ochraceum]